MKTESGCKSFEQPVSLAYGPGRPTNRGSTPGRAKKIPSLKSPSRLWSERGFSSVEYRGSFPGVIRLGRGRLPYEFCGS